MASLSSSKKTRPQAPAEDSSAFGPIAERFRRAGELDRAVSLCRDGLQNFPTNISARVTLGWALLELGKYDEARVELQQVLRRRPDNLAAIRALAELHDRSEQTMNLPMDGPGQWPPSEDAVELAATATATDDLVKLAVASLEEPELLVSGHGHVAGYRPKESPAPLPSADLDLAMWSPAPSQRADVAPIMAEALLALEAEAPDPELQPINQPVAVDGYGVSEADIAALIAEAESLEVAAESTGDSADDAAALILDADLDLGALGLVAPSPIEVAVVEPFEAVAAVAPVEEAVVAEPIEAAVAVPEPFEAVALAAEAPVAEPIAVVVAEPIEVAVPEPFEAVALVAEAPVAEPIAVVVAEPIEVAVPEPFEAVPPVEEALVAEPIEVPVIAPEPFEAVAAEEVAQVAEVAEVAQVEEIAEEIAEDAFVLVPPEPCDPVVELDAAPNEADVLIADADAQPILRFDLEPVTPDVQAAPHLAEVVSISRIAPPAPAPEPRAVVALEQLLSKVQARRRQMMAESVA